MKNLKKKILRKAKSFYLKSENASPTEGFSTDNDDYFDATHLYNKVNRQRKKLILSTTTGRSGLAWLLQILSAHANCTGAAERRAEAEAFYRFVKWNDLPVDVKGIIEIIKKDIWKDWKKADIAFYCSPYLAHDFFNLYKEFKADKVIWGINDPRFTVTSFLNKGWYYYTNMKSDATLVNGFQPALAENKWGHHFGRIVPKGPFYEEWMSLTRVGKIAWYLNTVNREIWEYMRKIPQEDLWIFKLEEADQNYSYYLKMADAFQLKPILSEKDFLEIKTKPRLRNGQPYTVWAKWNNLKHEWSAQEEDEFHKYAADYIKIYGQLQEVNQAFKPLLIQ
ncbi:MAG: hypothetical protein H6755_05790 [Candidatus Omnitrophica bacterium]|nr:hypothetical protein [Candidatus Omnitrophota bacterium]